MTVSNTTVAQTKPAGKENARVPSEIEMSMFNLRDTLSGITVRDANFSEFLAVLRKSASPAAKSN